MNYWLAFYLILIVPVFVLIHVYVMRTLKRFRRPRGGYVQQRLIPRAVLLSVFWLPALVVAVPVLLSENGRGELDRRVIALSS